MGQFASVKCLVLDWGGEGFLEEAASSLRGSSSRVMVARSRAEPGRYPGTRHRGGHLLSHLLRFEGRTELGTGPSEAPGGAQPWQEQEEQETS